MHRSARRMERRKTGVLHQVLAWGSVCGAKNRLCAQLKHTKNSDWRVQGMWPYFAGLVIVALTTWASLAIARMIKLGADGPIKMDGPRRKKETVTKEECKSMMGSRWDHVNNRCVGSGQYMRPLCGDHQVWDGQRQGCVDKSDCPDGMAGGGYCISGYGA